MFLTPNANQIALNTINLDILTKNQTRNIGLLITISVIILCSFIFLIFHILNIGLFFKDIPYINIILSALFFIISIILSGFLLNGINTVNTYFNFFLQIMKNVENQNNS